MEKDILNLLYRESRGGPGRHRTVLLRARILFFPQAVPPSRQGLGREAGPSLPSSALDSQSRAGLQLQTDQECILAYLKCTLGWGCPGDQGKLLAAGPALRLEDGPHKAVGWLLSAGLVFRGQGGGRGGWRARPLAAPVEASDF